MTPIAISNTRPGFVPFSARPLAIAGMTPKPPIRPAYRPAPYRPPMLSNPPRVEMGQGFKFSEIPLSLTLGVSGAAALVLASVIPTPVKELATVAGLGLIAFGVLNLFSGSASAETPTAPGSAAEPFKAAAPEEFQLVTAKIAKPSSNEVIDRGAFSYDYDVEIIWTNSSSKQVTIPYRIYVDEKPQPITVPFTSIPLSTTIIPYKGVAYTGTVKLGPGQSVVVPLEIDLKSEGFMAAGVVGITMTVQKVSPAGQVFDADRKAFIVK